MSSGRADGELERLRRENRELDDQVKLLVQTEQRLYRSQAEVDAQLTRIRGLAAFALESIGLERASDVLERALAVLNGAFVLDWAGGVRVEPGADRARLMVATPPPSRPHEFVTLAADVAGWVRALPHAVVVGTSTEPRRSPPLELLQAIWPEAPARTEVPGAMLALIPMYSSDRVVQGMLLAWTTAQRRLYTRRVSFDERDIPFLDLLGRHAERAVENAILSESLKQRGEELAATVAHLEQAQQALVQSQKMEAVGRLAGGIAHDFNNLLTVILGYAEGLHDRLAAHPPLQSDARQVVEAGRRAADITRQLLAFGRRQLQRREPLDLSERVRATILLLRRLVGENIRIALRLDSTLEPVLADRSQIEQVVLNLVLNARDAMPHGGCITVVTRRACADDAQRLGAALDVCQYAALEVADEGIGMDEATRARVFEPFFTTKEGERGTGLGLAVVYGVAKQSDGHIYLDSAPGRGSRFVVLLPRTAIEQATAVVEAAAAPAGRGRVLVVEDEAMIREFLARTLRDAGYEVLAAEDGESALDLVSTTGLSVDLLVTDVLMPGIGGVKVAELMRFRHPHVRVLFISGYAPDLLEEDRASVPSSAFLAKPITPQQLLRQVHEMLRLDVTPEAQDPR